MQQILFIFERLGIEVRRCICKNRDVVSSHRRQRDEKESHFSTFIYFFSITRARQLRFKRPTPRRIGIFYLLFVSLKNDAVDFGVHPRSTLEVCVGVRVGGRFIDSQFSGNKGLRYLHHPGWECLYASALL